MKRISELQDILRNTVFEYILIYSLRYGTDLKYDVLLFYFQTPPATCTWCRGYRCAGIFSNAGPPIMYILFTYYFFFFFL